MSVMKQQQRSHNSTTAKGKGTRMTDRLLSRREVAERLGVSPATVARLTEKKELEGVPVGLSRKRRQVRYEVAAVTRFIRRRAKA
jgi:excisionase family DNA binding protein